MTKLDKICKTLKTQGGSLAGYAREYIHGRSCFGEWHKHCPKGKTIVYGENLLTGSELCIIITHDEYRKAHARQQDFDSCLFLVSLKNSTHIDTNTVLNDRY